MPASFHHSTIMRSSLELAACTTLEFRQSIPGFPQKLLRPQLPLGGCGPADVNLPTSSLLETHPSQLDWLATHRALPKDSTLGLTAAPPQKSGLCGQSLQKHGRLTFIKCYVWCFQSLTFRKWELENRCTVTTVLKVCCKGSLRSPRPLQGFHKVKTIFKMVQRHYLPFLPPLQ